MYFRSSGVGSKRLLTRCDLLTLDFNEPALFQFSAITYHQEMNKRIANNHEQPVNVGIFLRKIGVFVIGLAIALFGMLRELFAATEAQHDGDRRLHDSDLSGELNHRTGRLDAGTDPYGWYDD
jgi:hypothetical protein